MLSEQEAIGLLLEHAQLPQTTEFVLLEHASDRVCAKDITAPIDVPGQDNSAMDGFAYHSESITPSKAIPISQRIAAGSKAKPLEPNTAARIFTGAPIPDGANSVVIQEMCDYTDNEVTFNTELKPGQHIRRKGEDIAKESIVLERGNVIGPAQIGIIASLGIDKIEVYKKLHIAVVTTGNELLEPGSEYQTDKRYNSNSYALRSAIRQLGFIASPHQIIADNLKATEAALSKCASEADIVISTGGVSVGDEDHVKQALQNIGEMHLWKIAMKPGKPLVFGHIGNTPFFGLPGNPVSAMVTLLTIARPYLLKCAGIVRNKLVSYDVTVDFDWQTKNRAEYLRVNLSEKQGKQIAQIFHTQDSGVQSSLNHSDGLIRIDKESTISRGDTAKYLPFSELMRINS